MAGVAHGALGQGNALSVYARMAACPSLGQITRDVLGPLCSHVGATSAVFVQYQIGPLGLSVGRGVTFALDPASLAVYAEHYHQMDLVAHAAVAVARHQTRGPRRETVTLWGLADQRTFRDTDYYNEFLRPFGLGDVLGTFIPVRTLSSDTVLCVGLHRWADAEPFGAAEMAKLRAIRPLVAAGLSNLALQEALDCADQALQLVAGTGQALGLAILDERLGLIYASPKAVVDLGLNEPLRADEWLREFADAAQALSPYRTGPITLGCGGPGGITATITRHLLSDGAVRYMVTTSEASIRAKMESRCRLHDLSAREGDVARLVAAGLTNESIGAQLDISVRTVENHLRAVYGKIGVNSRTQLISRLLDIA